MAVTVKPPFIRRYYGVNQTAGNATSKPIPAPITDGMQIADHDIMLLAIGADNPAASITEPGGFTLIPGTTEISADAVISSVSTHVANGELGAVYNITLAFADRIAAWLGNIANTGGINAVAESNGSNGASVAAPTVTTTVDNCLIVYVCIYDAASSGAAIANTGGVVSGPIGNQLFPGQASTADTSSGAAVGIFYETQATAGTTTARTFTNSLGEGYAFRTIAFAPRAAPTDVEVTMLSEFYNTTDGTVFTFPDTVAPEDNSLLICGMESTQTGIAAPTNVPSGLGLTWTLVRDWPWDTTNERRITVYQARCGAGVTPGTVTVTNGATSTGTGAILLQVHNADTTTPIPFSVAANNVNVTTGSNTLASPVAATSRPIAFFSHRANESTTNRANWDELGDQWGATPSMGFEAQWRPDAFETACSATWATSSNYASIALEIALATGGGGAAEAAAATIAATSTVTATRPTATVPIAASIGATATVTTTRPTATVPIAASTVAQSAVSATATLVPGAGYVPRVWADSNTRKWVGAVDRTWNQAATGATEAAAATIAVTSGVTATRPTATVPLAASTGAQSALSATASLVPAGGYASRAWNDGSSVKWNDATNRTWNEAAPGGPEAGAGTIGATSGVSATAISTVPVAATIAATSAVAATRPTATVPVAATVTGSSAVNATRPTTTVPIAASVSSTSAVVATYPGATVPVSATIAATSAVTATRPLATVTAATAIVATSNVIATRPLGTVPAAATTGASSTIVATRPLGTVPAATTVTGQSSVGASARANVAGQAAVVGTSAVTAASPLGVVPVLATVAAQSGVTAAAMSLAGTSIVSNGTSATAAAARMALAGRSTPAATSTVTAAVLVATALVAATAGQSTVAATATLNHTHQAAATVAASSTTSASAGAAPSMQAAATITATSSVIATRPLGTVPAAAATGATSAVSAAAFATPLLSATTAAHSQAIAVPTVTSALIAAPAASSTVSAAARVARAAAATVAASSTSSASGREAQPLGAAVVAVSTVSADARKTTQSEAEATSAAQSSVVATAAVSFGATVNPATFTYQETGHTLTYRESRHAVTFREETSPMDTLQEMTVHQ